MPLLKALRNSSFGTDFKGALSFHRVVFVAYAFVDDTDLIKTSKFAQDDFDRVLLQMQKALDIWSGMIWATGGAFIPEKTFWYAINFSCHEGDCEYTSLEEFPDNLEMNNPSGQVK